MYCKNCGQKLDDSANICPNCGTPTPNKTVYCRNCGKEMNPNAAFCENCGAPVTPNNVHTSAPVDPNAKSRLAAGLLGIFLGGLGVHNFYLGFTSRSFSYPSSPSVSAHFLCRSGDLSRAYSTLSKRTDIPQMRQAFRLQTEALAEARISVEYD